MDAALKQDHLFVSYAWEDMAVAKWITLKLTGFGYKVWCDQIKLFGGESFPLEIDNVIKSRTFRLLALLSPASLTKPNPTKERTLALHIGRERRIDFMIPLNLGVRPTELNWMLSDLTYVDFQQNWAEGLSQLLKALDRANAPRSLSDGRERVAASLLPRDLIVDGEEHLVSNAFAVTSIPEIITTFQFRHRPRSDQRQTIGREWAGYRIDATRFLGFHPPPSCAPWKIVDAHRWRETDAIHGVPSRNIVSNLLKKCLRVHCLLKGLHVTVRGDWLHIPRGLVLNDRLSFSESSGKGSWVRAAGQRGFFRPGRKAEEYRYFLAPLFTIRQDLGHEFVVLLTVRVHVTDSKGRPYPPRSAHARRKAVTKNWWNREWRNRHLALGQFLACSENEIAIGENAGQTVRIAANPLSFVSPLAIDETALDRRRQERVGNHSIA